MTKLDYVLDWIGGSCPVQAEGRFQGKPFYFRSRGNSWAFYLGTTFPDQWLAEFTYSEPYGDDPFSAGWMEEEEAIGFIEKSLRRYQESLIGK